RALGDDEADDVAAPRAVDLRDEELDDLLGARARRDVGLEHRLERADERRQLGADQLLEQRLLVAEVEVDRAFGDAGAARHVVEPRRREAARGELLEGGREDGFASRRALLRAGAVPLLVSCAFRSSHWPKPF